MGNRLKIFSLIYIPMCIGFFVAEPVDMPHVVVALFWITMLGSGLIYDKFPALNDSKWSVAHFWCHSIGFPLVIVGFLGISLGGRGLIQVLLALGSYSISVFILIFIIRFVSLAIRRP